jgi:hypothetical protein
LSGSVSVLRQKKQEHCHAKRNTAFLNTAGKKQIWTILKKRPQLWTVLKKKAFETATSLSKSALVTFPAPVHRMHCFSGEKINIILIKFCKQNILAISNGFVLHSMLTHFVPLLRKCGLM